MTPISLPELVRALEERGVVLSARLVVDVPSGSLTDDIRAALANHKPLLLQRVAREMTWAELKPWRWGGATQVDENLDNPGRQPVPETASAAPAQEVGE